MITDRLINRIREAKHPLDIAEGLKLCGSEAEIKSIAEIEVAGRFAWGVATFIFYPALATWWAFVVSTLWRWFAVPLGAPAIGVGAAGGLLLVFYMVRRRNTIEKTSTATEHKAKILINVVYPAICLGMGRLFLWLS